MFSKRNYREKLITKGLKNFKINIKETDLWISVDEESFNDKIQHNVEQYVFDLRISLEEYIKNYPQFYVSLIPVLIQEPAPEIAKTMISVTTRCGVGPMASVAGTFADYVGNYLTQFCKEVIIENGGDIYIKTKSPRTVAIFAGESPFSNKIGILIRENKVRGICTSSGTVGPSLSLGNSDATVIVAKNAAFADAAATMVGNMIKDENDIDAAIKYASGFSGILGALIIKNNKLGAWGEIEIIPLKEI